MILLSDRIAGRPLGQTAYQDNSKPDTIDRRTFVPYPATVARDLISQAITNLPPQRGTLDVSLNPVAHDINADIQTLSSGSSDPQHTPSSTESLYDDSKRSSSVSQENSQEVLTYQDSSALNNSNVTSSEY